VIGEINPLLRFGRAADPMRTARAGDKSRQQSEGVRHHERLDMAKAYLEGRWSATRKADRVAESSFLCVFVRFV
jgi:hypothetical protein